MKAMRIPLTGGFGGSDAGPLDSKRRPAEA